MTPITLYYSARQFLLYIYFKRHQHKKKQIAETHTPTHRPSIPSVGMKKLCKNRTDWNKKTKNCVSDCVVRRARLLEFDLKRNVSGKNKKMRKKKVETKISPRAPMLLSALSLWTVADKNWQLWNFKWNAVNAMDADATKPMWINRQCWMNSLRCPCFVGCACAFLTIRETATAVAASVVYVWFFLLFSFWNSAPSSFNFRNRLPHIICNIFLPQLHKLLMFEWREK